MTAIDQREAEWATACIFKMARAPPLQPQISEAGPTAPSCVSVRLQPAAVRLGPSCSPAERGERGCSARARPTPSFPEKTYLQRVGQLVFLLVENARVLLFLGFDTLDLLFGNLSDAFGSVGVLQEVLLL